MKKLFSLSVLSYCSPLALRLQVMTFSHQLKNLLIKSMDFLLAPSQLLLWQLQLSAAAIVYSLAQCVRKMHFLLLVGLFLLAAHLKPQNS